MILKHAALSHHIKQHPSLSGLYCLMGQDYFLMQRSVDSIKHHWKTQHPETEHYFFSIKQAQDWKDIREKLTACSLFSEHILLSLHYDKKTLDNPAKQFLSEYKKSLNPDCLLILQAPHLSLKQLNSVQTHPDIYIVPIYSLNKAAAITWIKQLFQEKTLQFSQDVPELIFTYTTGNLLAAAQTIEKIILSNPTETYINTAQVKEQLHYQCHYQLFELSEACLTQQAQLTLEHLRHAHRTGIEPTLVLWIITQDIRHCLQLLNKKQCSIPFQQACKQLNIWPQRARLFEHSLSKKQPQMLLNLLKDCHTLDKSIKSYHPVQHIWNKLEHLALSFCLNKPLDLCLS